MLKDRSWLPRTCPGRLSERQRFQWKSYGPSLLVHASIHALSCCSYVVSLRCLLTYAFPLKGHARSLQTETEAQATGMVSSWLATFQIRVLVWSGILGSLLISSSMEIALAALIASLTFSSIRMDLTFSAERRMFLGTASSLIMRSSTSTHCLRTFSAVVESPTCILGKRLMMVFV